MRRPPGRGAVGLGLRPDQRRVLALAIVTSLVLSVTFAPRLVAATQDDPGRSVHVVASGETLWSIAQRYSDDRADPRTYIDRLRVLNNLGSAELSPGQLITLPADP